jgi:hypothetical protein
MGLKAKSFDIKLKARGKKWLDNLPSVLWSIRTNATKPTGETPFFLVYGAEAVLPTDIKFGSPRVLAFNISSRWSPQGPSPLVWRSPMSSGTPSCALSTRPKPLPQLPRSRKNIGGRRLGPQKDTLSWRPAQALANVERTLHFKVKHISRDSAVENHLRHAGGKSVEHRPPEEAFLYY